MHRQPIRHRRPLARSALKASIRNRPTPSPTACSTVHPGRTRTSKPTIIFPARVGLARPAGAGHRDDWAVAADAEPGNKASICGRVRIVTQDIRAPVNGRRPQQHAAPFLPSLDEPGRFQTMWGNHTTPTSARLKPRRPIASRRAGTPMLDFRRPRSELPHDPSTASARRLAQAHAHSLLCHDQITLPDGLVGTGTTRPRAFTAFGLVYQRAHAALRRLPSPRK